MKSFTRIMELTHAYRLWQAPFVNAKFAPVLAHNDMQKIKRALDVGCGPGTSARNFSSVQYIGIDHNPAYIEYAKKHYSGEFIVADATTYQIDSSERFDFILANSFLHHVDTPNAQRILAHLSTLISDEGYLHVIELLVPARPSLARLLAYADRGDFPRALHEWQEIIGGAFDPVVVEPFSLIMAGIRLWELVYFKCRKKA
jgi:2-polyprenyl-3-methyl-5-hydroxy-6-metoxy-1,4-benzoquinol methylase